MLSLSLAAKTETKTRLCPFTHIYVHTFLPAGGGIALLASPLQEAALGNGLFYTRPPPPIR